MQELEQQPPQPKLSLKDTDEIKCECGSVIFQQAINLRRVSALLTGTGKDEVLPVAVIICNKCGKQFEKSSLIVP